MENETRKTGKRARMRRHGIGAACFVALISLCVTLGVAAVSPSAPSPQADGRSGTQKVSQPAKTPDGAVVPEQDIPQVLAEHSGEDVLVMFAEGYSAEAISAAINESGCTLPREITAADMDLGFATLKVTDDYDVEHAMTQLSFLPELKGAQPNFIYHADESASPEGLPALSAESLAAPDANAIGSLLAETTSINDPSAHEQWALDSIHAYDAWDIARADGAVTVAVLDNGCLLTHEDLKDNIAGQYDAINSDDEIDAGSHGTHVAGIAAAVTNNGKGVAGVSYNAKVLPVQVLSAITSKGGTDAVLRAFDYIFKNRPDVKIINMSFGGTLSGTSRDGISMGEEDAALIAAVDKAYDKGILTVCSSGNDALKKGGAYLNYPSDWLDNALSVISLSKGSAAGGDPTRQSSSNYNMTGQTTKDLAAPGNSIYSTWSTNDTAYRIDGGTSMAAPCVSGVAALVYSANPNADAQEVADIIRRSARKIQVDKASYNENGFSLEYGFGEVDALQAAISAKNTYLSGDSKLLVGRTEALVPLNPDGTTPAGNWEWSSSDENVATVADGVVTGVSAGAITISAAKGTARLTKTITVMQAAFAGKSTLDFGEKASVGFTSNPKAMWELSVSDKDVITLDSSVSDGATGINAYAKGLGTATLTAKLVSDPDIYITREITVQSADLGKATMSDVPTQTYTGSALEPKPVITWDGKSLAEGVDYTLSYANNTAVGEATVTATGKGNFAGTLSQSFQIIAEPRFSGATSMPVYSTCTWALENCTLKVTSGSAVLSVQGNTVTAKKSGNATIGIFNAVGDLVDERAINVYQLSKRTRMVKSALDQQFALTVRGASKSPGAYIRLGKAASENVFRFAFVRHSDGTYTLKNKATNMFMAVKDDSTKGGASVVQVKGSASPSCRWYITVDADNRLSFTNKVSAKSLAVRGGKPAQGRTITQYLPKQKASQKWLFS